MLRKHMYATLAALLCCALPAVAWAQEDSMMAPTDPVAPEAPAAEVSTGSVDKTGKMGVGAHRSLAGVVGVEGRYQLNADLGLHAVLGLALNTADGFSDGWGIGLAASFALKKWSDGHFSLIGGLDVQNSSSGSGMFASSTTAFGLSAGLFAEWFIDPRLSLHGQAGAAFAILTGEQAGADASGYAFIIGGDSLASFGITYWFE